MEEIPIYIIHIMIGYKYVSQVRNQRDNSSKSNSKLEDFSILVESGTMYYTSRFIFTLAINK